MWQWLWVLVSTVLVRGVIAGGLLGVGWLWVFGDDPWPAWAMNGLNVLIPVGGLVLWALFAGFIWLKLRSHKPRA